MSIELHAFIRGPDIPDRASWQVTINSLGFPVELHPGLDPLTSRGFTPCTIAGRASGFEIYLDTAESLIAAYPHKKGELSRYDKVISFRWGGHMDELACSFASAAALAAGHGATVYYPDDDLIYQADVLIRQAREVVDSLAA